MALDPVWSLTRVLCLDFVSKTNNTATKTEEMKTGNCSVAAFIRGTEKKKRNEKTAARQHLTPNVGSKLPEKPQTSLIFNSNFCFVSFVQVRTWNCTEFSPAYFQFLVF